jgi:KUP system potassium uptake protein
VIDTVGEGLWLVSARFGFFEIPDLRATLKSASGLDPNIDFDCATFVAARDLVVPKPHAPALRGWRIALFAFLYRNSAKIVDRFNLSPERVIEIARQIEI